MVSESFSDFIKSISISDSCKEILAEARKNKDSVFVDFKMSKGKMSSVGDSNTWIKFDVKESPLLNSMLKKMVESNEPSKDDIEAFDSWRKEVAKHISDNYHDEIKEAVCDAMFSGNKEIPFKIISADFELTDLPANDKVLVVRKASPPGVVTPPVSSEIMKEHEATGESFEEIINRKRMEGDPKYRWVVGAYATKSFFEANLSLAVDYSLEDTASKSG